MQGKIKTQYTGLLLIFVMFFSTFAFAIINSITPYEPEVTGAPDQPETIQRYLNRPLTQTEKTSLIQNQIAILEFSHTKDCAKCAEYRTVIESFYTKYPNILVVDLEGDKDSIQFVGKETQPITDLNPENLLDAYCKVSAVQTKECLLKNI
ncbi:MAG TPA: hypothetical protein VJB06_03865 [archaeon]|nr:hypothetical protein [archaeon]